MSGFQEVVNEAWSEATPHNEPCHVIFHKLKKLGFILCKWSRSFSSFSTLHLHMASEIILRYDIAQDSWELSPEESELRKRLQRRVISLVVLERAWKNNVLA